MKETNLIILNALLTEIAKLFFTTLNLKDDFFKTALKQLDEHFVRLSKVYDSNRRAVHDDPMHITDALYFAIIFGKVCGYYDLQGEIQTKKVIPQEIFLVATIIFLSFKVEVDFALKKLDFLMFSVLENEEDVRKKTSLIYSQAMAIIASKRLIAAEDSEKKESSLPLTTTTSSTTTSTFFSDPLERLKLFFRRCPLNISYIEINEFLRLFDGLGPLSNIHSKTKDISDELVEFLLANAAIAESITKLHDEQTVLIGFTVRMSEEQRKTKTNEEEFYLKWFYLFIRLKLLFPGAYHIAVLENDLGGYLEDYAAEKKIKDQIKLIFNLKMFVKSESAEEYYKESAIEKIIKSYLETIFLWCRRFLEEDRVELIAGTILDLAIEQTKELLVRMDCKDGFYLLPQIYCQLYKLLNDKAAHIKDSFQNKMADFFISILSLETLSPFDLKIIGHCLLKFPSAFQAHLSRKITENLPTCELAQNIPENEIDWTDRLIICKLKFVLSRSVMTHDEATFKKEIDQVYLAIVAVTYLIKDSTKELVKRLFHTQISNLLLSITERFLAREKLLVVGMKFNEATFLNVNILLYLLECYAQYQNCRFEDTSTMRSKNRLISAIFDRVINFEFNFVTANERESVIQMLSVINAIFVKLNKFNNKNSLLEKIKNQVLEKILCCAQDVVNQQYNLNQIRGLISEVRRFIALSKSNPEKLSSNNEVMALIKRELVKLEFLYVFLKIMTLGSAGNEKLSQKEIKTLKDKRSKKLDWILLKIYSKRNDADIAALLEYAFEFFSRYKKLYPYFKSVDSSCEALDSSMDDKYINKNYLFILTLIFDVMANKKTEPEIERKLTQLIKRVAKVRHFESPDILKIVFEKIVGYKIASVSDCESAEPEVNAVPEIDSATLVTTTAAADGGNVASTTTTIVGGSSGTAILVSKTAPDFAGGDNDGNATSKFRGTQKLENNINSSGTPAVSEHREEQKTDPKIEAQAQARQKFFKLFSSILAPTSGATMRYCPKR